MQRRQGFTLVEILVAMALTIFLMLILTQCFVTSLQAFRDLKGAGDLQAGLRTAATIIRRDLAADHFDGKRRLSDPRLWTRDPNSTVPQGPPREGFFSLYQAGPPGSPTGGYYLEGVDGDGFASTRATMNQTDAVHAPLPNQILHFTVKLRGNQQPSFFSAKIPTPISPLFTLGLPDSRFQLPKPKTATSGTFNSPWAEVAYFLYPNGQSANGTPLFALYRRQRLAIANQPAGMSKSGGATSQATAVGDGLNWDPSLAVTASPITLLQYQQISCWANGNRLYFNSPADLTVPTRRFANYDIAHYVPVGTGDDLLLNSVVSFEVKVLFAINGVPTNEGFKSLFDSSLLSGANPKGQPNRNTTYFPGLQGPRALDTWSSSKDDTPANPCNYTTWYAGGSGASMPIFFQPDPNNAFSVAAISVTLRTWDLRTEQTRQITVIQDM